MSIRFHAITSFPRGTLNALLIDAYAFDARFEEACGESWREFDTFFFDNPRIADSCGFITARDNEPVGFISWDPRNLPSHVEIGHNCIAARHKGSGYGKRQIREALDRIAASSPGKLIVSTNESLLPAQRMYEGAGFRLVRKTRTAKSTEFAGDTLHYAMTASPQTLGQTALHRQH